MVVVVSPPVPDGVVPPVYVFANAKAWRTSKEWKALVKCHDGAPIFIDLKSKAGSVPIEQAAGAIDGARIVVIGGASRSVIGWQEAGLDKALLSCKAAGGVIVGVGPVCMLLGAWYRDADGTVRKGTNLICGAIVGMFKTSEEWDVTEKVVASVHAEGHDRVKAYGIGNSSTGGAAFFYHDETVSRAEAIGDDILEAASIPKAGSLGRMLRLRKVRVPDQSLLTLLGTDPVERWNKALEVAATWLLDSNGTGVVSTGAGVSAESGIPTYRDEGGLWDIYDQMEVSHIKGFAREPLKCWRFELELYQMLKNCGPNDAHVALRRLEKAGVIKTVVTQNVDGLHVAAGSEDVIELHGSETRGICMQKGCRKTTPYIDVFRDLGWIAEDGSTTDAAPALPPKKKARTKGGIYAELTDSSASSSSSSSSSEAESSSPPKSPKSSSGDSTGPAKFKAVVQKLLAKTKDPEAIAHIAKGPLCPHCKDGLLKPDAVYFGEGLNKGLIRRAVALSKAAKAFLIVGTSGQVAPACKLPDLAKVSGKAKVMEVSLRETDLSPKADLLLLGSAATVLPALATVVEREKAKREQVERAVIPEAAKAADEEESSANHVKRIIQVVKKPSLQKKLKGHGTSKTSKKPSAADVPS